MISTRDAGWSGRSIWTAPHRPSGLRGQPQQPHGHSGDPARASEPVLVFAEGTRSRDGRVGRLRSGAVLLAAEHQLPIVPIYVSGTREAMPRGHHWMVFKTGRPGPRHALEIRFGNPIRPRADERAGEVMERVRLFLAESAARTERELETEPAHRRQPA
ncbi:MAG: lysophospholipid acyltransferase family protein [Thermoleophilaceae bacterium]